MITKDVDFRHSHTVSGAPASLLLVSTGNVSNGELIELFGRRLGDIEQAFASASFVELRDVLIVHSSDARWRGHAGPSRNAAKWPVTAAASERCLRRSGAKSGLPTS